MKNINHYHLQTAILVLLSFTLGCSEFIIIGILSDVSNSLKVPISQIGNLVTIFALIYAVTTLLLTLLLSSFNYYRTLLLLMGGFILSSFLSFLATTYSSLYISRILTGAVSGPLLSFALIFANLIAPVEKKATVFAWVFSGFSIASVFGVPLGAWISSIAGWHTVFLTITIISVVEFILLALILPSKSKSFYRGSILAQLALFKDRRIQIGVLLPFFGSGGIYVIYTYLRPVFTTVLGYSLQEVTVLLFLYGITTIFSNQFSGILAHKYGLSKCHGFIYCRQF